MHENFYRLSFSNLTTYMEILFLKLVERERFQISKTIFFKPIKLELFIFIFEMLLNLLC